MSVSPDHAPRLAPPRVVPTVIDVEASGFGKGSYPIEVGYVLPDGKSECMLIRPPAAWRHWDAGAERLHHISRELLETHGKSVQQVADRLDAELAGRTVYTDGWGNDYSWLSALYEAAGRTPTFRLESVLTLLDEEQLARWDSMKARVFDENAQERHRASADARLLQATVMRLQDRNG